MSIEVKGNNSNRELSKRVDALESHLFQFGLVLLAGGFVVVGGLLAIIAALLAFVR